MFAEPRAVLLTNNSTQFYPAGMTRTSSFEGSNNLWTRRFMAAAVAQGAVVVSLTVFLVLGQISFIKPEVSRVMAAGGAGTWFTFGYVMYILVGVLGVAVSALFYQFLGVIRARPLANTINALAWLHLVLMNAGTAAATGLLMYAGYVGGASMLPETVGGRGFDAAQAHQLMAPFVEPIAVAILLIAAGVMAGGAGFLVSIRFRQTPSSVETNSERETSVV
jgi:hypothetical protein